MINREVTRLEDKLEDDVFEELDQLHTQLNKMKRIQQLAQQRLTAKETPAPQNSESMSSKMFCPSNGSAFRPYHQTGTT